MSSAPGLTSFHVQEHIYKEGSSCLPEGKARMQDKAVQFPGSKLPLQGRIWIVSWLLIFGFVPVNLHITFLFAYEENVIAF